MKIFIYLGIAHAILAAIFMADDNISLAVMSSICFGFCIGSYLEGIWAQYFKAACRQWVKGKPPRGSKSRCVFGFYRDNKGDYFPFIDEGSYDHSKTVEYYVIPY